jgi:hypothetical protein
MAVRLSALRAARPLSPGRFLELISIRGRVDHRARTIVRLVGLGQLENPVTSSGMEPATFRLLACASANYDTACPQGTKGDKSNIKVDFCYILALHLCAWIKRFPFFTRTFLLTFGPCSWDQIFSDEGRLSFSRGSVLATFYSILLALNVKTSTQAARAVCSTEIRKALLK